MYYNNNDFKFEQRLTEWSEIEDLVLSYQLQFKSDSISSIDIKKSKESARLLLDRFHPFFKKYITLFKTGQINWNDMEMKQFISSFIDEIDLKRALGRKKQSACYRNRIHQKFNFILETYGALEEEEILLDLQSLLLTIAKRYEQIGKNFCAYVYNSYRYEVARHIKKFIKNPLNISYKNLQYEDCINGSNEYSIENSYEDNYYEDLTGIPNMSWIQGLNCSDIFSSLSNLDRKILVKYYLEEWKDRQIADNLGMHINTVNQKRRNAAKIIANNLGFDLSSIKRTRKSGKKAVLPSS